MLVCHTLLGKNNDFKLQYYLLYQSINFSTITEAFNILIQINVREYRRGYQKWKIQRNWQHMVHKTKKNKTETIQRNWQHMVHKTKKNKTKTIQRNWQHRVHKTKKNITQHNPEQLAT